MTKHDPKRPAFLKFEVTQAEKRAWIKAAYPGKLEEWVRDTLNRESRHGNHETAGD